MLSINEVKTLARQCTDMIDKTWESNTLLSRARRYEIRNLQSVLLMLLVLDHEGCLYDDQLKDIFEKTRKRINNLVSDSQSAGYHDHMLIGRGK